MGLRAISCPIPYRSEMVSIYPKAEMGLRAAPAASESATSTVSIYPKAEMGLRETFFVGHLMAENLFQSTRRQRWV